jgi:hypothetical protein
VRSRLYSPQRIGDPVKVIKLTLRPPATPTPNAPIRASAPAPATASTGFWESASTTEKVVIVGAGGLAALLLYYALKPSRRRR